jgi:hypothetical protein
MPLMSKQSFVSMHCFRFVMLVIVGCEFFMVNESVQSKYLSWPLDMYYITTAMPQKLLNSQYLHECHKL